MVKNAPAVAHSRTRHHSTRAAPIVDRARFVCRVVRFQCLQVGAQRTLADERFHLLVKKLHVLDVNVRGFDCHRAVEKDRKGFYLSGAEHFAEQQRDELRAANSECRHEHLAAALDRVDHDSLELCDGFCKRAMIATAISRFEKKKVRLLKRLELLKYRRAAWPEIARENNPLRFVAFINDELDTC